MSKITFQYIWVEKYRCFDNAEFNFSAKHQFHYDKDTNVLTHKDHSEDYVDNFFDENIDLTVVVGNNGAGKTTLIKMICENIPEGCGGIQTNCIVVVQVDNKLICYYYLNSRKEDELKELSVHSSTDTNILCINLAKQKTYNEKTVFEENLNFTAAYFPQLFQFSKLYGIDNIQTNTNVRFIRLTQTLDHSDYREQLYGVEDLSTSWILHEQHNETLSKFLDNQDTKLPEDSTISYFHYNFEKQIDFFCNYMKKKKADCIIPFRQPNYVEVSIDTDVSKVLIELKEDKSNNKVSEDEKKEIRLMVLKFWNEKNRMTRNLHIELSKGIILNCIRSLASLQTNNQKLFDIIVSVMRNISDSSNLTIYDKCRQLLNNLRIEIDVNKRLEPFKSDFFNDYIKKHLSFLEFIDTFKYQGDNPLFVNSFTISLEETDVSANHLHLNVLCGIEKFYNEYKKIAGWHDFLHFSWGLSSGEMALLNIYSRFFSIAKKESNDKYILTIDRNSICKVENALIFIDEADMLLHPEWQQKYINSFLSFLKDIYAGTHLQIIVATHSPSMLSDIPKQNVIYLCSKRNDEGKWKYFVDDSTKHAETFGANIFRLYNDAFFLKEGAIGAFAEKKITKLLKMIDDSANENAEEIQKLIRLIGDPFLKTKVETYFLSKLNQEEKPIQQRVLENEIAWLTQKLDALKAMEDVEENSNGEN